MPCFLALGESIHPSCTHLFIFMDKIKESRTKKLNNLWETRETEAKSISWSSLLIQSHPRNIHRLVSARTPVQILKTTVNWDWQHAWLLCPQNSSGKWIVREFPHIIERWEDGPKCLFSNIALHFVCRQGLFRRKQVWNQYKLGVHGLPREVPDYKQIFNFTWNRDWDLRDIADRSESSIYVPFN